MSEQHIVRSENGYKHEPFDTLDAAMAYAKCFDNSRVYSRLLPEVFRYDAYGLARLAGRTSFRHLESNRTGRIKVRPVDDGLDLFFGDIRVGHWSIQEVGSGIDGRVMPGDLTGWIINVMRQTNWIV